MVDGIIKGQIVAGDYSKLIMRVKSTADIELGEIVAIDAGTETFLLQVYDLSYSSQISNSNLEMISGMKLEDETDFELVDSKMRNYRLAQLKPLLSVSDTCKTCKRMPPFFSKVREVKPIDLRFITTPENPLYFGELRSGSRSLGFDLFLPGKEVFSHHVLVAASTGKGKSNLMKDILWDALDKDYVGMLVLDPHDEYYGRVGLGLKDHNSRNMVVYYTPTNPPPGARSLVINLSTLKPEYFQGAVTLSDPQRQALHAYYRKFGKNWIIALLEEKFIDGVRFHEDTIAVVKRKLLSLLSIDIDNENISCVGIFQEVGGENTISDICRELEQSRTVIIDTSFFSGALEVMVASMVAAETLKMYKRYKRTGLLESKPVVSIILEEAPRVLGKKVLEQGTNIFDTIAREGRKFQIGLVAITQLPSEIPKSVLANMNTKIILGIEMGAERNAVIESAAQDLSDDSRTIASLDIGEAIVTSIFTRFAVPLSIPFYPDFVEKRKAQLLEKQGAFVSIQPGFMGMGN
tara:strand:+ start:4134 stop:5693 length:1560 start_codon:yes stop_codon:yes gene_type:complete